MKRLLPSLAALLAILGISLSLVEPAEAARRDGLQNSELIEDKDDVFTYPQLAADYSNLLSFEYGIDAQTGNALALFGNDSYGLGVAFHRGDLFEMRGLSNPVTPALVGSVVNNPNGAGLAPVMFDLQLTRSYPYASPSQRAVVTPQGPLKTQVQAFETAHNIVDFIGGYDTGNGSVGGRLSFGIGGARSNPDEEDKTDEGQMYVQLKGGYSGTFDALSIDTSLSLLFNRGDDNEVNPQQTASFGDNVQKGRVLGVGFDGRLYNEFTDTTSLGGLLDIGYSNFSVTQDAQDDDPPSATLSSFSVQAGAGPVFHIGGEDEEDEGPEMQAMLAQFGGTDDEAEDTGTSDTGTPDAGSTDAAAQDDDDDEDETATDATKPSKPAKEVAPSDRPEKPSERTQTGGATAEEPPAETKAAAVAEGEEQQAEEESDAPTRRRTRTEKSTFEQSAEVAAYGVFGFNSISGDPDDTTSDDAYSATGVLAPGLHVAGEFHILKWLYFRSGAQYYFFHYGVRQSVTDGENRAGGDISNFGWSAGMGVEVGDFRFDGSFNRGFLRSGPNFLGGFGGGLFTTASAQYRW